jgi:hypothetical protein
MAVESTEIRTYMDYISTLGFEGFQKLGFLRIRRSRGLSDQKEGGMPEFKAGLGNMATNVSCCANYQNLAAASHLGPENQLHCTIIN